MIAAAVIAGVVIIGVLFIVSIYNKLVTLRNRFKNAFAQIDVQLKRRYDLIPNLVETVKGYASHEKDPLEAVINARNRAMSASGPTGAASPSRDLRKASNSVFSRSNAAWLFSCRSARKV